MSEQKNEQNSEQKNEGVKTFSEDYVKQLREEAKENRVKFSETQTKLNELQKQLEEKEKAEREKQGEFKKLYEQELEKAKGFQSEIENIKPYKEKFETLEKTIREELLSKLTDVHKTIANDLPIEKLKAYVNANTVQHNYDNTRTGGMSFTTEGKNWTDFNSKELDEISKKNKDLFNKLYENYLKTKK